MAEDDHGGGVVRDVEVYGSKPMFWFSSIVVRG